MCKSQTSLSKAYAKLCGGAGCPPWRSGGGEMPACVARPTEGPTVYMCVRKRKGRSGRCSPCKFQAEMRRRGGRRRGPSGGARTESVTRSAQGLSGLLDGTARPKAVLREGYGVRGAPGPLAARNCSGGAYRRRRSWQRDAAALVVRAWGCGRDGDRAQGSTGVQFKEERRRSWRERKGRPSRRSRRRARVWPVRGRKEEGDDRWGLPVSGAMRAASD